MMSIRLGKADCARVALAMIRLINGSLGLFAPQRLIRQLDGDPESNAIAIYALRMFGIRTILIGRDLLRGSGPERDQALRVAPIIHASDTASVALLGLQGRISSRLALKLTAISALNTVLALIARPGARGR
jgi:hypothetical protein